MNKPYLEKKVEVSIELERGGKIEKSNILTNMRQVLSYIKQREAQGWKNENINFLDGSIQLRMEGEDYGVKAKLTGLIKPIKTVRRERIFVTSNPLNNWVYKGFYKGFDSNGNVYNDFI